MVHLFVTIARGLAHHQLQVGLDLLESALVIVVVLPSPWIAMALVWTARRRLGLMLLSASMLGSLLFGWYHHFLVAGPDHVHTQLVNAWGTMFDVTAYGFADHGGDWDVYGYALSLARYA